MVVHDTLRAARGPGRVVDRERLIFVKSRCGQRVVSPLRQEILELVFYVEQSGARKRVRDLVTEFGTVEHLGRSRLLEDVADFGGRQARVDAHECSAGERHTEMCQEQGLRVQRKKRDPVAFLESLSLKRRRKTTCARAEVAPGVLDLTVHDSYAVRISVAGALQKVGREQFVAVDVFIRLTHFTLTLCPGWSCTPSKCVLTNVRTPAKLLAIETPSGNPGIS